MRDARFSKKIEFSLCLSRACLGKLIIFIYKWLKKRRFNLPLAQKTMEFTKTRSGQTQRNTQKCEARSFVDNNNNRVLEHCGAKNATFCAIYI